MLKLYINKYKHYIFITVSYFYNKKFSIYTFTILIIEYYFNNNNYIIIK